jgi:hypothetical protein
MSDSYIAMGHHALAADDTWATQVFARPAGPTSTYLFGLLYTDKNSSGAWEPHNSTNPNREGLGNVAYRVFNAGTANQVGSDSMTFDNGGFSFRLGSGTYDLEFSLPAGSFWVRGISLAGQNVDLGDLVAAPPTSNIGDYDGNGIVDAVDYVVWRDALGDMGGQLPADGNGNGVVDAADYAVWRRHFGQIHPASGGAAMLAAAATAVPEPAALLLLGTSVAILTAWRHAGARQQSRAVIVDRSPQRKQGTVAYSPTCPAGSDP